MRLTVFGALTWNYPRALAELDLCVAHANDLAAALPRRQK
jgi:hypothetical protein